MKVKAIVHEAEEGGYWAEVPTMPGCFTQAESYDELLLNLREAVDSWLAATEDAVQLDDRSRIVELAV